MNKRLYTLLGFLSFVFLFSCSEQGSKEGFFSKIKIEWELVTNFANGGQNFEAAFIFKNESNHTLEAEGWKLFFNMAPRTIVREEGQQNVTLTHINGDWYSLAPEEGFELAPGEELIIPYIGIEGVIKESDAPMGLYFVLYNKEGEETEIIEVDTYSVRPFLTEDQLLRGPDDKETPASAEKWYEQNEGLTLLAKDDLQPIIPSPVNFWKKGGFVELDASWVIYYEKGLKNEANRLKEKLEEVSGGVFDIQEGKGEGKAITLGKGAVRVDGKTEEAYELKVGDELVQIKGSDAPGVFYGVQSLLALVDTQVYTENSSSLKIPKVEVEDAPRFDFRSLHLDVARNFQNKETVLRLLDVMAHYKLNHFLFYISEDEGWRLEIEGLPELTEVGAQRGHVSGMDALALHPAYGSGPIPNAEGSHGSGYYTKEDFVEILKYAKDRHITIIPELNFPAHARAVIKSMEVRYKKFMDEGNEEAANEYRLIDPDDTSIYLSAQSFKDNVVSVARPSTYRFYDKVVEEISKMYKEAGLELRKFHAGGDEVPEGSWTASPMADELLKSLPEIDNPKNLQAYFFEKLLERLEKYDMEIHVWEEMALLKTVEGTYVPNPAFVGKGVVPYIWNNMFDYPDLGYQLANQGYEVVLCNVSNFYFDLAYNNDPNEPGLYWAGFVDTQNAWTFAPFDWFKTTYKTNMGEQIDQAAEFKNMERIQPESKKNIMGLEAQLWSETIKGRDMVEYYTLPKLLGFAESAWAKEREWENTIETETRQGQIFKGWNRFANTIAQREYPKLGTLNGGYEYRIAPPGAKVENERIYANVNLPGLEIRYTQDGSEPSMDSPLYQEPLENSNGIKLKAFDALGNASRTVEVTK
ncbi:family 20 glycosylhydrolase [Pleomorphovibrio marinus]|uniref:family 20 glycosylhydrolase n=1 Tax=Pleomorphovibrio marinus TaxID=2164132 RepID=UPI000E0C8A93|nr:family 20 glycosylhydrolase [Pleomorphovibrio marinus]